MSAEPTRARYPDEQGHVAADDGVRVVYEVYGDDPDTDLPAADRGRSCTRACGGRRSPTSRATSAIIAIDPRGNGRSDRPRHAAAYSRAAHVRDVLAVLDATGTDRAMIVSISPRAPLAPGARGRAPRARAGGRPSSRRSCGAIAGFVRPVHGRAPRALRRLREVQPAPLEARLPRLRRVVRAHARSRIPTRPARSRRRSHTPSTPTPRRSSPRRSASRCTSARRRSSSPAASAARCS